VGQLVAKTLTAAVVVSLVIFGAAVASAGESCEYLERAEVQKAIGHKVKLGPAPDGVGGECAFRVRGAGSDVVNVWVLEGDDAKTGYDVGKQLAGDEAEKVRGVGDKAVYTGDPLNTLYALDGDTLVYLQYYVLFGDDSPKDVKRAVVKLTKKALARAT
jgi:hypothetical protein